MQYLTNEWVPDVLVCMITPHLRLDIQGSYIFFSDPLLIGWLAIEDVQAFLGSKGYCEQATTIASALDLVASLHYKSIAAASQSTLDKFITISQ